MSPDPTPAAYPRRPGNLVQLWAGEGAFFSRLSRAMEQARRAVWLTCSFFHREWRLPDGSLWWDALQRAADRGLDVRVLFWRNPAFFSGQNIFQGTPEDLAFLRARGATFRARWDSSGSDEHHCHHQKLWLIDPDQDDGIAFVGGMVKTRLDTPARVAAGHPEGRHDATLELRGPAVVDVVHGFVQRWNEAAPDPSSPPPWPDAQAAGPLPWPSSLPPACGATEVQVLRTVRPGIYHRHPPPPGASPFSIERGEASIWRAYLDEIDRAQETIYLENQHPGELRVLEALERALGRGVRVLFVVPGQPMAAITREKARALQDPQARYRTTFETLARLGAHPYFCLASLAHSFSPAVESREEIYVHAKTCVIDGAWMTCGSANLVDLSLWPDHTELNVASWGQREASAALESLLGAHLGGARGTHRHLVEAGIEAARRNAALRARGKPWNGTLMALDAARYADP